MSETKDEGGQELRALRILEVRARGDGVAEGPTFVPFTLPGEWVRARLHGDRGELVALLEASRDRVAPACSHFGVCGGCALQHWRREAYGAWKRGLVREALARAGLEAEIRPLLDAAGSGRRRATFHAVRAKAVGFLFGFARRASNELFDLAQCPVLAPALEAARPALRALAERLLARPGRLDMAATLTDAGLDVELRGGPAGLSPATLADLAQLAREADLARLSRDGATLYQARKPVLRIGAAEIAPPPGAFLQATADGEAALGRLVVEAVGRARLVADLYAGLGAFAFRLAADAAVHAVEGDADAVNALKRAAAMSQGLKPVSVERRDLARAPLTARELARFDAVVLDPPRAGAPSQVRHIAASKLACVVMVSCNPATFARDAATLKEAGFALDPVTPIDQFLWSPHVELVGAFRR